MVNLVSLYYFMIPALAVAALLQSTTANRLAIVGVKPDLVLLIVLIGTLVYGLRPGLVWAFIGGLFLDIFSGGPMGSSSLALMAATLVAGLGHRTLSRYNLMVPVGVVIAGTLVYSLVYIGILYGLDALSNLTGLIAFRHPVPIWATFQYVIAPSMLYNAILMLFFTPLLNRIPESQESIATTL